MRPIQVTMDEGLLRALDVNPRVREFGRSAVFRELVREYRRRERHRRMDEHYARVYGGSDGVPTEDAVREKGNDLHVASMCDQPGEGATLRPEGKRSGFTPKPLAVALTPHLHTIVKQSLRCRIVGLPAASASRSLALALSSSWTQPCRDPAAESPVRGTD